MPKGGYGSFGILSKQYDVARKGFPREVVDYLWSKIHTPNPSILDLGCGTGISTRQLAEYGMAVIGVDKDPEMIRVARAKHSPGLHYVVASAEKLPFKNGQFDVVTAFSALHWFANKQALQEIIRILKPNGVFFVANKNDTSGFNEGYRRILRKFINIKLPNAKLDYNPKELLLKSGFMDVEGKSFSVKEVFALPQAIAYLQSVSTWNLVPVRFKTMAHHNIVEYCETQASDGLLERKVEVVAVIGKKLE